MDKKLMKKKAKKLKKMAAVGGATQASTGTAADHARYVHHPSSLPRHNTTADFGQACMRLGCDRVALKTYLQCDPGCGHAVAWLWS
jgi:hypothetical protein